MDIALIDETFDLNQTGNYHISIQVALNGYSFSVIDPVRNKYILLKHYAFTGGLTPSLLEEKVLAIQGNDEFLSREYKSVSFSFMSPKYTLIPAPLFNKDKLKNYFEFNHLLDDLDEIHYNRLETIDAYNLFAIPAELSNIVYRAFGNVKYFHNITPLAEQAVIHHARKGAGEVVISCIYGNFADILVLREGNLLLCNTFNWKNEDDLAYFILYVYDQMKIRGEEAPLVISGELRKDSAGYELLRPYVRNISFEKRSDRFVYSYTFDEVDHHWFVNLFNLRLCV